MLCTYRATLRGESLEWRSDRPRHLRSEEPVEVHITILDEMTDPAELSSQGQRMAAVLEALSQLQKRTLPTDAAAWERDLRQDRSLPGRDASPDRQ
jgi:hypothetical protein